MPGRRLPDRCETGKRSETALSKWRQCEGNMALVRDMVFKRAPNIATQIKNERLKVNLKGVEKVTVSFDPFGETAEIRKFANLLHAENPSKTNPKCVLRTEVVTDRSEETVRFDLIDGKRFIFKCANLTCLEIYKLMNRYITPLAPVEDEANVLEVASKTAGRKKSSKQW